MGSRRVGNGSPVRHGLGEPGQLPIDPAQVGLDRPAAAATVSRWAACRSTARVPAASTRSEVSTSSRSAPSTAASTASSGSDHEVRDSPVHAPAVADVVHARHPARLDVSAGAPEEREAPVPPRPPREHMRPALIVLCTGRPALGRPDRRGRPPRPTGAGARVEAGSSHLREIGGVDPAGHEQRAQLAQSTGLDLTHALAGE